MNEYRLLSYLETQLASNAAVEDDETFEIELSPNEIRLIISALDIEE